MPIKRHTSPFEKEFEVERVILFSDAVFAIAITLLIIDVKFPELPDRRLQSNIWEVLNPIMRSFWAFAFTFVFIGRFWSTHVGLFRLLRKYDQGLINRNLLFLFFIVSFPFSAAGISHVRGGFILPIYIYVFNLAAVTVTNFLLTRYIFYIKPWLSVEEGAAEKKFHYRSSLYTTIAMGLQFLVMLVIGLAFPGMESWVGYSCLLMPVLLIGAKRLAKKYQPVEHA